MEMKPKWMEFAIQILIAGVSALNARTSDDERFDYPANWTEEDKRDFLSAMQSVTGYLPDYDVNDMKLPDGYLVDGLSKMMVPKSLMVPESLEILRCLMKRAFCRR